MNSCEIVVLHIMKTAGTSLRRSLEDAAGPANVYTNEHDLAARRRGWYPGPAEMVDQVCAGRHHGARIVIGHLPYVVVERLPGSQQVVTLLREPVARTVSMIEFRRRRMPHMQDAPYEAFLELDDFVEKQVRDYQTKMFAFDSVEECPDHVNLPLEIDDARFGRALDRIDSMDVVGVTENLPAFHDRMEAATGLRIELPRLNRGRYEDPELNDRVRDRIAELTVRDRQLYEHVSRRVTRSTPLKRRLRKTVAAVSAVVRRVGG